MKQAGACDVEAPHCITVNYTRSSTDSPTLLVKGDGSTWIDESDNKDKVDGPISETVRGIDCEGDFTVRKKITFFSFFTLHHFQ